MPRAYLRRVALTLVLVSAGLFLIPGSASAQDMDTMIYVDTLLIVDASDTLGSPGQVVPITVFIQNLTDSIAAFDILISLSNPDLLSFPSDTTIDTCFSCIDSACTIIDTFTCTLETVPSTVQGSLVQNWDLTTASSPTGNRVQIVGIADIDADEFPLPILPFTNGVLLTVFGRVNCNVEDTDTIRTVDLTVIPNGGAKFSTAGGTLIPSAIETYYGLDTTIVGVDTTITFDSLVIYKPEPKLLNGSLTVPFSLKGDLDGNSIYNVIDVVMEVNIAFKGGALPCPPSVADLNCDGNVNVIDVVLLVNAVFRGGPNPGC